MRFHQAFWAAAGTVALAAFLMAAAAKPETAFAESSATESCGGFAGQGCPTGTFCQHPTGTCHGGDVKGTCEKVPKICPKIFLPVCGCNRKTYGNDCERQAAKVSKDHDGKCR